LPESSGRRVYEKTDSRTRERSDFVVFFNGRLSRYRFVKNYGTRGNRNRNPGQTINNNRRIVDTVYARSVGVKGRAGPDVATEKSRTVRTRRRPSENSLRERRLISAHPKTDKTRRRFTRIGDEIPERFPSYA